VTGFRTDKVHTHGYLPDYLRLAAEIGTTCPSGAVVCEVGVEHGASLEMWQHLFPSSTVIGVDRAPEAPHIDGTIKVTAQQDDPGLADTIRGHAPGGCDLIVDDASHIGHLSAATFGLLWPLVKPGRYYVLEDWADPWVFPSWARWPDVDPSLAGDELVDYAPQLITALQKDAQTVTYTREGLVIIQKLP
jgi:hypothetical protein